MKMKSVYKISNLDWTAWELANRKDLCLSIFEQTLPGKKPKIYHHFFVSDRLTDSETTTLSCAFSDNKTFSKGVVLEVHPRGDVICDDDSNILNPACLDEVTDNQRYYWEQSLEWPSEDTEEMEADDPCQHNVVENADW